MYIDVSSTGTAFHDMSHKQVMMIRDALKLALQKDITHDERQEVLDIVQKIEFYCRANNENQFFNP